MTKKKPEQLELNLDRCLNKGSVGGWHHDNANWKLKTCTVCKVQFKPRSGVQKFCSNECKGKWKYISGTYKTENQYATISGNWRRYFSRLCNRSKKRENLTVENLLDVLEKQKGKCALTGRVLECKLEKGVKNPNNASIDRIIVGKEYEKDNIQLVCSVLNSFRGSTPLEEFIEICREVAEYND